MEVSVCDAGSEDVDVVERQGGYIYHGEMV